MRIDGRNFVSVLALLTACGDSTLASRAVARRVEARTLRATTTKALTVAQHQSAELTVVVQGATDQPVAGVPVTFEILGEVTEASLSQTQATSTDDGLAQIKVLAGNKRETFVVRATLPEGGAIEQQVVAGQAPSPIDGQFSFEMKLEPLELLDPASPGALVVDDVTRALIDPGAFVTDGIVLANDAGVIERHGLCRLINDSPAWMVTCKRDFGALINQMVDGLFSLSSTAQKVRARLVDASLGVRHMHLGGVVTVASVFGDATAVQAEIQWDKLYLPQSGDVLDMNALGLSPFNARFAGTSTESAAGHDLALGQGKVSFAYAQVAMAVFEQLVLPEVAPSLDGDKDGRVQLGELFAYMQDCDQAPGTQKALCESGSTAMATLVQSGLLAQLNAAMPAEFDVTANASLPLAVDTLVPSALSLDLAFAGVDTQHTTTTSLKAASLAQP